MKHITIFLLLLIICLSAFSQADPVAPSQTTTNTTTATTIESSKIPDLIEFFQSYTAPKILTPHSSFLIPHYHSILSLTPYTLLVPTIIL